MRSNMEKTNMAELNGDFSMAGLTLPEAIVCDLDGTTFTPKGEVSERTANALRSAIGAGIEVLFATGRPDRVLDSLNAADIGHQTVICSNGAHVIDVSSGNSLSISALDTELTYDVISKVRSALPKATFAAETLNGFIFEQSGPILKATEELLTQDDQAVSHFDPRSYSQILKVFVIDQSIEHERFAQIGFDAIGNSVYSTFSGVSGTIEFGPHGVNKATALQTWSEQRNIDPADIWAFGDMPNDLEMLQWAGTGWAMANAHPQVLEVANRRCGSNREDGLAQVVETLLTRKDRLLNSEGDPRGAAYAR